MSDLLTLRPSHWSGCDSGQRQGVGVLGTSPGERLTGVAIVVYVYIKIFVLVFIGTITETCIYWNKLKDQWTMPIVHGYDLQK